jgi:hypothetical protein
VIALLGIALLIQFNSGFCLAGGASVVPPTGTNGGQTDGRQDIGPPIPPVIDPLGASPTWITESNQVGAAFGRRVSTAGDVNGDGCSDVLVGALLFDNIESDEGRAFLYLGSRGILSSTPAWTAEVDQEDAHFHVVAAAGDVNGDGFDDVIIGAPDFDNGQVDEGRVYVYYGSPLGLASQPGWVEESNIPNAQFGAAVGSAGDVNGDGYPDIIIGAPGYANGKTNQGRACVYHGSATGLGPFPTWVTDGNSPEVSHGFSVGTAGDVNNDGYSDVIVGAHWDPVSYIAVYHGSITGLSPSPVWGQIMASTSFGYSVATAGDVNGDGYSDVVTGDPFYTDGQARSGRVIAYYGSAAGLSSEPSWIRHGHTMGQPGSGLFGYQVGTAGDVNNDGFSDIIVGAPEYGTPETWEGNAFVYLGSETGLAGSPDWTGESNQSQAFFGESVGAAGDVNGDEFSDIIVGAVDYENGQGNEGRAYIYRGSCSCSQPNWLMSTVSLGSVVPAGFHRYTQSTNYWSATAVRANSVTSDWDLSTYELGSGGAGSVCFNGLFASSTGAAGMTDFVIGDFNHNAFGTYYVYTLSFSGDSNARVEWDGGSDQIVVNGPSITRSTGANDLIEVWDVFLEAGRTYTFEIDRAGVADTKLMLFNNPGATYWVGRSLSVLETTTRTDYEAPATDWYGVAVVNDNGGAGSYTIRVGTCETPTALVSGASVLTPPANRYYSYTQSEIYWSAVGVRGAGASDWDLSVYGAAGNGSWPECFSDQLAGSNLTQDVDFVIGDFNHNPTGTHYAHVFRDSGTGDAVTEWDDGAHQIVVGQPPISRTTNQSDVLEVWDVLLTAGVHYDLFFEHTGAAQTKALLFQSQNGVYWTGRASRVIETTDLHTPFTASATDWYAVVVVNDDGETGSYQIGISTISTALENPGPAGAPRAFALHHVAPNPAAGNVRIGFELPLARTLDFQVLDATGRVVAAIPSRTWEAGRWETIWDGRNRRGTRLPAGVYWVQMVADGRHVGRTKLALVR